MRKILLLSAMIIGLYALGQNKQGSMRLKSEYYNLAGKSVEIVELRTLRRYEYVLDSNGFLQYDLPLNFSPTATQDLANEVIVLGNPANNLVIQTTSSSENFQVQIYTMSGEIITPNVSYPTDKEINIELDDYLDGIYLISISSDKGHTTKKFIKRSFANSITNRLPIYAPHESKIDRKPEEKVGYFGIFVEAGFGIPDEVLEIEIYESSSDTLEFIIPSLPPTHAFISGSVTQENRILEGGKIRIINIAKQDTITHEFYGDEFIADSIPLSFDQLNNPVTEEYLLEIYGRQFPYQDTIIFLDEGNTNIEFEVEFWESSVYGAINLDIELPENVYFTVDGTVNDTILFQVTQVRDSFQTPSYQLFFNDMNPYINFGEPHIFPRVLPNHFELHFYPNNELVESGTLGIYTGSDDNYLFDFQTKTIPNDVQLVISYLDTVAFNIVVNQQPVDNQGQITFPSVPSFETFTAIISSTDSSYTFPDKTVLIFNDKADTTYQIIINDASQ